MSASSETVAVVITQQMDEGEKLRLIGDDHYYGRNGAKQDYEQSVMYYKQSIEKGNMRAYFDLAYAFHNGKGVEKNPQKAIENFRISAKAGHPKSQYFLGAYYEGFYESAGELTPDIKQAVLWYEKAVNQKDQNASMRLIRLLENGIGVDKDEKRASELTKQLTGADLYDFGDIYFLGLNYTKSFACYQESAKKGYELAHYDLGLAYQMGYGVAVDAKKAFEEFVVAANQDFPEAQMRLGKCYENEIGTTRDLKLAISWYEKAANQKNATDRTLAKLAIAEGNYRLGECYEMGHGVDVDAKKAFEKYEVAANHEFPEAQLRLGNCYEDEVGTSRNLKSAFSWYEKAASQKNATNRPEAKRAIAEAHYRLGECYEFGRGTNRDLTIAFSWYEKAADQNYVPAIMTLAYRCEKGIGCVPDYNRAVKVFEKALAQEPNNDKYLYALGSLFKRKGNFFEAEKHFIRITKNSSHWLDSQLHLGELYRFGCKEWPNDPVKSFHCYMSTTVTERKLMGVYHYLGSCYENGLGTKPDPKLAFKNYEIEDNENSNPDTQYTLGRCNWLGIGVKPNIKKAAEYYEIAAAEEHIRAEVELGLLFLPSGVDFGVDGFPIERFPVNVKKGLEHLKIASSLHDFLANLILGHLYEGNFNDKISVETHKVHRNFAGASKCYYEAAFSLEHQIRVVQELPQCYKVKVKPLELYIKSAELGNIEADKAVRRLESDILPGEDLAKLASYFWKKAKQYQATDGKGVNDIKAALECYELAARNSHKEAQEYLGEIYMSGKAGNPKDLKKSEHYLLLAANQKSAQAQYNLWLYYSTLDEVKDLEEASKFLSLAIEQKYSKAVLDCGECYEHGKNGFPKDLTKAVQYYLKAEELGDKKGVESYKLLNLKEVAREWVKGLEVYINQHNPGLDKKQNAEKTIVKINMLICSPNLSEVALKTILDDYERDNKVTEDSRWFSTARWLAAKAFKKADEFVYGNPKEKWSTEDWIRNFRSFLEENVKKYSDSLKNGPTPNTMSGACNPPFVPQFSGASALLTIGSVVSGVSQEKIGAASAEAAGNVDTLTRDSKGKSPNRLQ